MQVSLHWLENYKDSSVHGNKTSTRYLSWTYSELKSYLDSCTVLQASVCVVLYIAREVNAGDESHMHDELWLVKLYMIMHTLESHLSVSRAPLWNKSPIALSVTI